MIHRRQYRGKRKGRGSISALVSFSFDEKEQLFKKQKGLEEGSRGLGSCFISFVTTKAEQHR
jgi:hypothetical protein